MARGQKGKSEKEGEIKTRISRAVRDIELWMGTETGGQSQVPRKHVSSVCFHLGS
jgi:hypothetical protein